MKTWRLLFLTLTAVVIGMELLAAFDNNPGTDPWTDLLIEYVPVEVTFLLIGGLVLWLPLHFGIRYYRKHQKENTHVEDQ